MDYFYDHQTDKLSIMVADLANYDASSDLARGVIIHVDSRRRPLAVEISDARSIANVLGLASFEQRPIGEEELAQRLTGSEGGRRLWQLLNGAHAPSLRLVAVS